MIVNKDNWKTVLKAGMRFRMNTHCRRFAGLNDNVRRHALNNKTFVVTRVQIGSYPGITYKWTDDRGIEHDTYRNDFSGDDEWFILDNETATNKGQATCIFCGVKTEQRRDFATFEVRDMCPRCKV